jgi:hypothetical protein
MAGEAILAAVLGAIFGGGGVRLLGRLVGPERDESIARYYREVIKGLREENTELRSRLASLEERITGLELAHDDPPGHLG